MGAKQSGPTANPAANGRTRAYSGSDLPSSTSSSNGSNVSRTTAGGGEVPCVQRVRSLRSHVQHQPAPWSQGQVCGGLRRLRDQTPVRHQHSKQQRSLQLPGVRRQQPGRGGGQRARRSPAADRIVTSTPLS
ncbi:E3 ubiquitin-protein ligase znrf2 [Lates japonicus]|uniref:E3 ubiquitin-protein ligase znrf2 n=1 Tax=Lates japonicus TaxID=270547 RepID=A0AAD3RAX1_LATJO|nr:E3 ubiquitin-protein ligase znrf2 [Lates japonicus]